MGRVGWHYMSGFSDSNFISTLVLLGLLWFCKIFPIFLFFKGGNRWWKRSRKDIFSLILGEGLQLVKGGHTISSPFDIKSNVTLLFLDSFFSWNSTGNSPVNDIHELHIEPWFCLVILLLAASPVMVNLLALAYQKFGKCLTWFY